jgi:hypothetical protein
MCTEFWLGNFTGRDCFQNLCIDVWILLKCIAKKKGVRMSAGFFWLKIGRSDVLM